MSSLRDQIAASAPTESTGGRSCHPGTCLTGCGSGAAGWRWYAAFGWVPVCACAIGGVVPAHLRRYDADLPADAKPVLDATDAEIERLTEERDLARKSRDEYANRLEVAERMRPDDYYQQLDEIRGSIADERVAHAEREHALMAAEAERDQLRYERRLLGFARATLDLVAAGDETRWPQARREAEDIAQRIVDEIGHPVTDEPALGPSLRAQLQQAEAVLARSRAALATFEGRGVNNFDIPTPAEIREAWRASLDQPAQQGDDSGQ